MHLCAPQQLLLLSSAARRSLIACSSSGHVLTIASSVTYEETTKKSRFVAVAAPVSSAEVALECVRALSDEKARHNCYAYRLASGETRSNGDGEPGGTAGAPILAAIVGAGLSDTLVVVARYKSPEAPKLGTGGLVRAYGGAAAGALALATTVEVVPLVTGLVSFKAADTGSVFRLLGAFSPRQREGDGARLEATFEAPRAELSRLAAQLKTATQGRVSCRALELSPDDPEA